MLIAGLAHLVAGGWALYCSTRWFSEKAGARVPFRRSVVVLLAAECVNGVVGIWLQIRNFEVLGEFTEAITKGPGLPPGFADMMKTFMQGGVVVGLVIAVGWGIAKLVFLAWAHRYAGTPEVVAHLDRKA